MIYNREEATKLLNKHNLLATNHLAEELWELHVGLASLNGVETASSIEPLWIKSIKARQHEMLAKVRDRIAKAIILPILASSKSLSNEDIGKLVRYKTPMLATYLTTDMTTQLANLATNVRALAKREPSVPAEIAAFVNPTKNRDARIAKGMRVLVNVSDDKSYLELYSATIVKRDGPMIKVKYDDGSLHVLPIKLGYPGMVGPYYGPKRRSFIPTSKVSNFIGTLDVARLSKISGETIPHHRNIYGLGDRVLVNLGTVKKSDIYLGTIVKISKTSVTVQYDDGDEHSFDPKLDSTGILGVSSNQDVYNVEPIPSSDLHKYISNNMVLQWFGADQAGRIATKLARAKQIQQVVQQKPKPKETVVDLQKPATIQTKFVTPNINPGTRIQPAPVNDDVLDDDFDGMMDDDDQDDLNDYLEMTDPYSEHYVNNNRDNSYDLWDQVNRPRVNHPMAKPASSNSWYFPHVNKPGWKPKV